jgi:hypothetical protein
MLRLLFITGSDGHLVAINPEMVTCVEWALPVENACPDERRRGRPRSSIGLQGGQSVEVDGEVDTVARALMAFSAPRAE